MSKLIKQMELDALKGNFKGVRDYVVLSIKGLNSLGTATLRTTLRRKKIRLQVVKNSLTRRVFSEIGLKISPESKFWTGPTALAWGTGSIAELSRAIESELTGRKTAPMYKDKVTVKDAIADGEEVPFALAVKMPTLAEALGQIVTMILSPGSAIAGCLDAPGGQIASQVQTISEKKEEAAAAPEPAPAAG